MVKGYSGVFRLGEATSTWDADSPVCILIPLQSYTEHYSILGTIQLDLLLNCIWHGKVSCCTNLLGAQLLMLLLDFKCCRELNIRDTIWKTTCL